MRIEISRSLLAKLMKFVKLDYYDNRLYDFEYYLYVKLTEDEQIELRMLDKELMKEIASIKREED